jgi:outer membrane protein insertion porin family
VNLKTSTYFWFLGALILLSCNITKKVPEGQTLYHKHDFEIIYPADHRGPRISRSELEDVVRIRPNNKILGIFLPLRVYNSINEDRVVKKRQIKNAKLHRKNIEKKIPKAERKNRRRIERAMKRGDELYLPYRVKLKDTLAPRKFIAEWLLYEFGESPNLMNENLVTRSTDQIRLYLVKKGYYNSTVKDTVIYPKSESHKQLTEVKYRIDLGLPHTIDSIYYEGDNPRIHNLISNYLARNELLKKGDLFDRDVLDGLRFELARMLRNETFYDFSPNLILYKADTTVRPYGVQLGIVIRPRTIRDHNNKDSVQVFAHRNYRVGDVYYHIIDTSRFQGNYMDEIESRGLTLNTNEHLPTLDTFFYEPEGIIHDYRRKATFLYNSEMPIRPELLEMRNYLEHGHWYRAYYLDRTYNQMLELDIFQSIQPVLIDNPNQGSVDVHYYLIPANTQKFSLEPRATNSNGFLGVSASVSYRHRNLFKSGGKFITSMSVGIESQPPILDASTDRRRETFYEIGPTAKLTLPGLLPISPLRFSKRQTTSTEFSTGFNYQNRQEFSRQLLQFNYLWRWRSDKLQTFQMGLPLVSGFKFVRITNQSSEFLQRINDLNDLFLKNAYSNQLIFNDFKLVYTYSNERLLESVGTPKRTYINYDMTFDLVGNSLDLFTRNQEINNSLGVKTIFGVPFSQFARLDNEIKVYQRYSRGRVLAMRFQAGMGYTYGNSNLALPFDYAFFAGGSNDNRGWRAREMSPGAYQYHRDVNRTLTQFGDIRLGASFEYRFNLLNTQRFKGAVFSDMGNLWTLRADPNRPGGQFTSNFYKQIAISGGFGLRIDATFLVIRLDLGIPILNPAMSPGARWIWNSRELFEQELDAAFAQFPDRKSEVPRPFMPRPHFAIGFPF